MPLPLIATTPTRTGQISVDLSDFEKLVKQFSEIEMVLGRALAKAQPEFGAYMAYSIVLELGTRDGRIKPRPHIGPSVERNMKHVMKGMRDLLTDGMRPGRAKAAAALVQKTWAALLNDRPRRDAVEETARQKIFELGHHRRSIRGSGKPVKEGAIRKEQDKAATERLERRLAGTSERSATGGVRG